MQKEIIDWVVQIIIALLIVVSVTGCGQSKGWVFQIGTYPVSEIDHKQALKSEPVEKVRY